MITGYKVANINGEKVLILYLNYRDEFGMDFKGRHRYSNMKQKIEKFIKDNKIRFDGEKIALSVGGVILAVLLISGSSTPKEELNLTYVSDHIIPEAIVEVVPPSTTPEDVVEESVENEIESDTSTDHTDIENMTNSSNQNTSNSVTKPSTGNTNSTQNSQNQKPNVSNDSSNPGTSNSGTKEEVEKPSITEQQVTVYRSNGTVITLSLEEYLIGVVGAEMPASFPLEALKAQAVVARTYALKKIESGGKLTDTVSTQSYKDNNELKKLWGSSFDTYYQKIKTAVTATKGLSIYYQGKYIDAVYHSTSNGKTQDAAYVWGNSVPYLKSVDSSWDKEATSYLREVAKDFTNVLNLLGVDMSDDISFEILSRDYSGRVEKVRVGNQTFSGVEFRNLLGLRSADFDLSLENGNLIITTRGYGHGVGMSQYGASGMAKAGYTYQQILKHYYTGVSIY